MSKTDCTVKTNQDNSPSVQENYNSIDVMRFICAVLVVAIHARLYKEGVIFSYLEWFVHDYLARIAVPFFFITSGFFLYKKIPLENFNLVKTKKYAWRIFRLYLIWTIIYSPYFFYLFYRHHQDNAVDYWGSYFYDFIIPGYHLHLWYLNAIIFSVILLSFLLYIKVNVRLIFILAFFLYVIGLSEQSWNGVFFLLSPHIPSVQSIYNFILKIFVTTRNGLFEGFPFIFLGMLFAYYRFNITQKKALAGLILSMTLFFIEDVVLWRFAPCSHHSTYFFLYPASFFIFYLVKNTTYIGKSKKKYIYIYIFKNIKRFDLLYSLRDLFHLKNNI